MRLLRWLAALVALLCGGVLSDAPGANVVPDFFIMGSSEELREWIERRFKANVFATARSTTVPYQRAVLVREGAGRSDSSIPMTHPPSHFAFPIPGSTHRGGGP
jgi:hypothetical protein